MRITVLRKVRYEQTFIYVLQFADVFQYLFAWNGEIYQNNIVMKPRFANWMKWKLGKMSMPYSAHELEEGEKVILSSAMAQIDKNIEQGLNTRQARRTKEREYERRTREILELSGKPCQWQAIEMSEGFWYRCLTHGQAVKMVDGEKPVHDILIPANF